MPRFAIVAGPFLCCAIAVAAQTDRDDQALVETAANAGKLHRVTESPFIMTNASAALCRPAPVVQPHNPHSDYYCHVFINDAGLATMKTGEGKYPKGTVIMKQKFADRDGTKTELFTLMRKMNDGYDADNGNWEYSIVDRNATKVLSRGRTESCIDCHTQYAGSDYVTRLYMKSNRK
jgi:hypothetical protein